MNKGGNGRHTALIKIRLRKPETVYSKQRLLYKADTRNKLPPIFNKLKNKVLPKSTKTHRLQETNMDANNNKRVRSPESAQETPSKRPCDPRAEAAAPSHKEPFGQRATQRPKNPNGPSEAQTRHMEAAKKAQEELAKLAKQRDQAKTAKAAAEKAQAEVLQPGSGTLVNKLVRLKKPILCLKRVKFPQNASSAQTDGGPQQQQQPQQPPQVQQQHQPQQPAQPQQPHPQPQQPPLQPQQ